MDTFRFVHAADLHLDTPFTGLGEVAPRIATVLREASLVAFDRLVDLVLDRQAAFLLLAGDTYDGPSRGLRAQFRLHRGLTRLAEAGVATLMVHGNHDPVEEGWSAIERWPTAVTVFDAAEVGSVEVRREGRLLATVHGISYAHRVTRENLARRFRRPETTGVHIGLLHATVGDPPGHSRYAPASVDDLRAAGMDYWALGHVHRRQVLSRSPWVVYPGNLQGRSPKPSERDAKGAVVVEVRDRVIAEPEFVPCDLVRFVDLSLDVGELAGADLGSIVAGLQSAADEESRTADGRGLVVRARLVGRGSAHETLRRPGVIESLLRVLRDARTLPQRVDDPFIWWERLQDVTAPSWDRDTLSHRGDLVGRIITETDRVRSGQSSGSGVLDPLLGRLRAVLGSDMVDAVAASLDEEELWHQAERIAVEALLDAEQ